ncbi:MAG TPA: chorismate synthase [Methanoregulaceae archaeon]|nr:chorismate synthase [Methanoregulaceae archaeon]HQJ87431.1 chorismate synthase [Methanoregulaceae archaeon]
MNTFGRLFRVTTFGESHGPALGAVVDGCPPRIPLSEADIQPLLDRRRPGTGPLVSPRREADRVRILSGVFEGVTTGAPIALLVGNEGAQSGDYEPLREVFRPGHADCTFAWKYGVRDHRGGGRSSGRETVGRVAAGAIALRLLALRGIRVGGRVLSVHGVTGEEAMAAVVREAASRGDSVGGIVEVVATGVPPGLGEPVFGRLDAAIAGALMGIGAVKGVEIGEGFGAAGLFGSEMNDPILPGGFASNRAGGILGGISNGEPVVARLAVKPTPSIARPQSTVDTSGRPVELSIAGRHDPCIAYRLVPVAEAMLGLVLADALLLQEARSVLSGG